MMHNDLAYIETNRTCAYCGSRNNLTIDHIYGREGIDWNKYDNLICLCQVCHNKKDQSKEITFDEICNIKRVLMTNYLTVLGVNMLKMCARGHPQMGPEYQFLHLIELGYLINMGQVMSIGGAKSFAFSASDQGKRVFERWFKN